jgi:SSS family solute:Na+ symporter
MDSFIYQYAIGGLVFAIGLVYAWNQGFVGPRGKPLRRFLILLAGFAALAGLQGYLQFAPMAEAPAGHYDGPPFEHRTVGAPIDYGVMIAYFVAILAVGTVFSRRQKTTRDFFFAGQRFSWWLVAMSMVATTVGSYSFVKYSTMAYRHGLSSSQSYLNDFFWIPLFLFGWLPILYFSRITSIPEYFERRFSRGARMVVTTLLLIYLVGYVGVNLFTMGKALNGLLGWEIPTAAVIVAIISATYVTFGGQTSVIMTDLLQGAMLLATGGILLYLGIDYLGDAGTFWSHLPRTHREAFSDFNADPSFPAVGIFWQDAMANTAAFYFLNQGILMRFMSAKSVREGRKAAIVVPVLLMPLAAIAVASGGWVGRALVHAGVLPDMPADQVFYYTAEFLAQPGVFGLVMAALTAALMSTVDTLVTAIAAIWVNDVYRPYINKNATEKQQLRMARVSSLSVMILGLLLVPVFMKFNSIYEAHGAFTAAVTPPLVVALLFSVFWRRYTRVGALATMLGGTAVIALSLWVPEIITPFAHGVPTDPDLEGYRQYKYMRAFLGLGASAAFGIVATLLTKPESAERQAGLVWGTIAQALDRYKGSPGVERQGQVTLGAAVPVSGEPVTGEGQLPAVRVSRGLADALGLELGALIYVTDTRRWLGGLRSVHAVVTAVDEARNEPAVELGPIAYEAVVSKHRADKPVRIEWLY